MHVFNVVPPKRLLVVPYKLFVQTTLSQILQYDVAAQNKAILRLIVIWSAILAISEALFLLKLCSACWAAPSDESGCELNKIREFVLVLVKFFDKVQGQNIVATIPQFNL